MSEEKERSSEREQIQFLELIVEDVIAQLGEMHNFLRGLVREAAKSFSKFGFVKIFKLSIIKGEQFLTEGYDDDILQ